MRIAVLIKQVPDTYGERELNIDSGCVARDASDRIVDEINERALEVALRVKDADKKTEIIAVTMGPQEAKEAVRKCLSMGADSGLHIQDDQLAGSDSKRTAQVLAAGIRDIGADVVLAGNESTDGRGGVVPAMIAEYLGLPLLSSADTADFAGESVTITRTTNAGLVTARASMPLVLSVTERSAEARFPNFKGIMTAKRKPVAALQFADVRNGISGDAASHSEVLSTIKRPGRTAGTKIIDEGDAGVKLAEYLAAARLS